MRRIARPSDLRRVALLLALVGSLVPAASSAAESTAASVMPSVVKVHARRCGGIDRSATGFIWGARSQVVTSMHVVVGCADISVYFERPGASRAATVRRVLRRADLALLTVEDAPAVSPLPIASQRVADDAEVFAVGYYLDIPTANRKSLRLGFAGRRLRDIIPPSVRRELEQLGFPDVNLEVINLEGHLLPGMSGAPIVNAQGQVVAIADGGLEAGAAGASWGIPIAHLEALSGSAETMSSTPPRQQIESLFAVDLTSTSGVSIRCGDLQLQRLRTRPFAEIVASSDDILGLQQLSAALGFPRFDFQVDVYQDVDSGATVAVPSGTQLTSRGSVCVGTQRGGTLELYVQGKRIAAPQGSQTWLAEVQTATLEFMDRALPDNATMWQSDPQWSYWQPQARYDGFLVRRFGAGLFTEWNAWNIPGEYLFATLAARGQTAIGILVRHRSNLRLQLCRINRSPVACPPPEELFEWSQMVLTTHLATFPLS